MSDCLFNEIEQTRTNVPTPNTWTPLVLPVGARNALVQAELKTANFRISFDNTISADVETGGGSYIPATGLYVFEGTNTGTITFYISVSAATDAIIQYSKG